MMGMGSQQMGAGSPPPPPPSGGGASGAGQPPSPDQIKQQILQLLSQVDQMAQQNGVDLRAILMQYLQSGGKGSPPRPPSSPSAPSSQQMPRSGLV